ncbi:hypothetical protein LINPERHAP1_LOCUS21417 [Linum perenne]
MSVLEECRLRVLLVGR